MSHLDLSNTGNAARGFPLAIVLPIFAFTLFLSAFLLFSVQPFFAKMVLPRLGGSPAVWSVAMVFFQSVLLAGYGYAHLLSSRLNLRIAVLVHGLVMVSAFLALPIAIPDGWEQAPENGQAFWLLGMFTVAVGLPFFAVSANGPLLQAWFSKTGHSQSHDPYFLYASSNIGSFASLILYIIFFEPGFPVPVQSLLWTSGMLLLTALVMTCGLAAVRLSRTEAGPILSGMENSTDQRTRLTQVLTWIGLAFVPSGLLVGVTAHVSVDVAAAPFLWVVPLALFLLTFVFAFQRKPFFKTSFLEKAVPILAVPACAAIFLHNALPLWFLLPTHFVFFFFASLYCHSLLVERRPGAGNLTAFYLWMSAGGVLGGIFSSLLAPVMFNWVAEYPVLILAALCCRPSFWKRENRELHNAIGIAAILSLAFYLCARSGFLPAFESVPVNAVLLVFMVAIAALIQFRSMIIYAMILVFCIPLGMLGNSSSEGLVAERTFFGVVRVSDSHDGRWRTMSHGTTIHGAMEIRDVEGKETVGKPEPLTYYHRSLGMARALFAMQEAHGGAIGQGGIVGLGTGSLLCHTKPGENWTVYEIDKSVIDLASDQKYFRFISDCAPETRMVLGDARLEVAREPDGYFDYLLVDAFSSDSIPVHLMTIEALKLYMEKVKEDGIVVLHITNRYVEMMSVLAAAAQELGWELRGNTFHPPAALADNPFIAKSTVAVLARSTEALGGIGHDPDWKVQGHDGVSIWTDNYSNIVSAILRRRSTEE